MRPTMLLEPAKPRVVIVGGGFAGLVAAYQLRRFDGEVLLLDRRNIHTFQPLLYQVATAGLSPANITSPLRGVVGKQRNTSVMLADVQGFRLDAKQVLTDEGPVRFDYLILAVGATHNWFGNDHWQEHALGLKSIEEALRIRYQLLGNCERAEWTKDRAERQRLLTTVIIGGGPTGVEMAGAVAEFLFTSVKRDFHNINTTEAKVILLQGADRLLPPFHEKLSASAKRCLEKMGVEVITSARVTDIRDGEVDYRCGEDTCVQRAGLIIWGAGVKANPLATALATACGQEPGRGGHIVVDVHCRVPDHPHIYAAGDCACYQHGTERPLPGVAQVAIQQGRYIAKHLRNERRGKETKPFSYFDKGSMATIGRNRAVLESGWLRLTGWLAWMGWLVVHLLFIVSRENRFLIVFQWFWNWWTRGRSARLMTSPKYLQHHFSKGWQAPVGSYSMRATPSEELHRAITERQEADAEPADDADSKVLSQS